VPDYVQSGWCVDPTTALKRRMPCATEGSSTPKNLSARSLHSGGVNVALCDGSVRFINDSISQTTWQNLGSSQDGNILGEF
jgi:prepilin-type processing-associated H-X9-DG protein